MWRWILCHLLNDHDWTCAAAEGKQPDGSEPRGYSPVVPCRKEERIERFHQVIDELDIAAVIATVNKLKKVVME